MRDRVCPWRHAYTFDNVFRKLIYSPRRMFGPYVEEGMSVMDVGCGMGFNSIALAGMVGEGGLVIAVDLQQEMLDVLGRRAARAGVADRIRTVCCQADSLGVDEEVGFICAFWMVHEVPDAAEFFREARSCLAPAARFFVAEPKFHVSADAFEEMLATADAAGLTLTDRPRVTTSRAAVFKRRSRRP